MAIPAYTIIPDDRLAPDAPVRSVDALALRDNPLAIAQADEADATPQVYTDGIADGAVTGAKIDWATVASALFSAGGIGYNDGTTAFDRYAFYGSRNTNPGDDTNLFSHPNSVTAGQPRIYIPVGCTKLEITISAACTTGALAAVGIDIIINGVAAEFRSLPNVANAAWQTAIEITPGATGWQGVDINAHNTAGSAQNNKVVYLYGLTIRASG